MLPVPEASIFGDKGEGTLNGYKALRTNNLPKGLQIAKDEFGIAFGNWNDYFIGQWGALENQSGSVFPHVGGSCTFGD